MYDAGLIIMLEMLMAVMSTVGSAVSDQARSEYGYEKTLGYFAFTSARWVFWISAIIMAICFFLTLFLRESRSTRLLQQKLDEILALVDSSPDATPRFRIDNPDAVPSLNTFLTTTLFRPLRLLFTEPIVILCSALNAISFAMIYGLTEGLTIVYSSPAYDLPDPHTTSSLAFVPLILGLFFSLPFRAHDARRFRELNGAGVPPERKLWSFTFAVPALALGFWVFAWTIPPLVPRAPLLLSMAALVPVGFAINDLDSVL
ncbi:mfs multidrug transporter [Neofusicoccum parvum]|nr:mfs multidrug transporter [Neofusicoccum parvum]